MNIQLVFQFSIFAVKKVFLTGEKKGFFLKQNSIVLLMRGFFTVCNATRADFAFCLLHGTVRCESVQQERGCE